MNAHPCVKKALAIAVSNKYHINFEGLKKFIFNFNIVVTVLNMKIIASKVRY